MTLSKLYKVDSKGKIRVYYIEIILDQYRMITGVLNGKEVKSKWTTAKAKNVGRSNETSGEEQAVKEMKSRYEKKIAEGYYKSEKKAKANPDGNFFKPMLAYEVEKVIDKYTVFPLLADPKLDGMRMTINTQNKAISRKGKRILTVPHIEEALFHLLYFHHDYTLDGELYNHAYKDNFNTLMSIARQSKPSKEDLILSKDNLQFHIYDMYDRRNPDRTALDRKKRLYTLIQELSPAYRKYIKLVPFILVKTQNELDIIKEKHLKDGYEGTITRGPGSVYENKRSHWLLKHKDFITEEFKMVDILSGKGNRDGIAGTVIVERYYSTDFNTKCLKIKQVGCGIRGSHGYAKELLDNKDNYIGKLATIRHFGETPDGSLRFPVCIDVNRTD